MEADSLSSDFATRCRADDVTMVVTTSVSFEPARSDPVRALDTARGNCRVYVSFGEDRRFGHTRGFVSEQGVGNRSEPPCEAQLFASGCKHNRTYLCDASSLRKNIC